MKYAAALFVALAAAVAQAQTDAWTDAKNNVDNAAAAFQEASLAHQRAMGSSSAGNRVRACQVVAVRHTEWKKAVLDADSVLKSDIAKKEQAFNQAPPERKDAAEQELKAARDLLPWMSDQVRLVKIEPSKCR